MSKLFLCKPIDCVTCEVRYYCSVSTVKKKTKEQGKGK